MNNKRIKRNVRRRNEREGRSKSDGRKRGKGKE